MVDLNTISVDKDLLSKVPASVAAESIILPLSEENGTVTVAISDETAPEALSDLAFLFGKRITAQVVSCESLKKALKQHYGVTLQGDKGVQKAAETQTISHSDENSAVSLVNRIISEAIDIRASDIHVEAYEQVFRVRYRIDGVLQEVSRPPLTLVKPVVSRLKIMADLDIAEKRRPQDGRIRMNREDRTIDIRVSTLPTDFGEKVVLRILDKSQLKLDLSKLGFEEKNLKLFRKTLHVPYGMILVTGPTGSGKTTTLYAALNHINEPGINITTIEDPIEYNLPGINQTHVRSDIGLTFAAALRSILRQDPNVIMVGEIRDAETAEITVRAALTGHLVFSTLHTNDACSAIIRLVDMGVEPFLVASSLKMILAQRLLRKLCDNCRKADASEDVQEIDSSILGSVKFYSGKGCSECRQSGYKGRTAVYEVLPVEGKLSDLISHGASASDLRECAQRNGMTTLREAAMKKAQRRETSLQEVLRETV